MSTQDAINDNQPDIELEVEIDHRLTARQPRRSSRDVHCGMICGCNGDDRVITVTRLGREAA